MALRWRWVACLLGFMLGMTLGMTLSLAAAAEGPVWRYGLLAGYPPFQVWPEGGWPGGADLDLLRKAARAAGGRIEPVRYTDFAQLLADLQAGRLDVASAMSRTPEREQLLAFSAPYARIEQVMVVRAADGDVPLSADLAGRRVAVVASYASAAQVARLFPLATRVPVPDLETGLRSLGEGRADLFIESAPAIAETLDRLQLPDLRIARPVVLGSDDLHLAAAVAGAPKLALLAEAVAALDPAERQAAVDRWSAAAPVARAARLVLSADEQARLSALPPLRVAVVAEQAPFSMAGADGRAQGLAVETLGAALRHLGLPAPDWQLTTADAALAALRSGDADLALGLPEAASRTSGVGFVGPFIEHPLVLVARRSSGLWSLEQMGGRRLAMPSLQVPQTLLLSRFPRVTSVACATVTDCLRQVAAGNADAMTADIVSLALVMGGSDFGELQIVGTAGDLRHERGVAVSPGQRTLVPLLQRALDVTAVADLPTLKRRWLERPAPQQLARRLLRNAAPWVLGALALLMLAWWWHSAGLRAEVARTRAARAEAERAAAAASRFIAFLAHEVRNSLHSVIAATELLRGERGVAPSVTEPLGQSARSTLALLNGLLDRERLAAGALTLDPGPARLGAVVGAVVQEMGPAAQLAGVELRLPADADVWLRVDALRVQQVLRNLLSNAIKYAGPGVVRVDWAFEAPDTVRLSVVDQGPGLAAAQRETLFQPFRSAGPGRPDSAGLGLALGRDLARTLGGDLVLETPPEGGVAAHFSFRAQRLPAHGPDAPAAADARPRRVLLVEDAEVYALLLQRALEARGWQVAWVAQVAAARARLVAEPFDLLLTDLHLPDGSAADVLDAAVRPGLRRVVMSADVDAELRQMPGADQVVTKIADVQLFVDRLLEPVTVG